MCECVCVHVHVYLYIIKHYKISLRKKKTDMSQENKMYKFLTKGPRLHFV